MKGKWVYLYRAVDSSGATIDFLLSAKPMQPPPSAFWPKPWEVRTIRTLGSSTPTSMPLTRRRLYQLKDEGVLEENCQHRPVQYLNNVVEQDHRAIKRRIRTSQLVFLSICETCNYQGLDFLDFLRSGETDIADFADSREKRRF